MTRLRSNFVRSVGAVYKVWRIGNDYIVAIWRFKFLYAGPVYGHLLWPWGLQDILNCLFRVVHFQLNSINMRSRCASLRHHQTYSAGARAMSR